MKRLMLTIVTDFGEFEDNRIHRTVEVKSVEEAVEIIKRNPVDEEGRLFTETLIEGLGTYWEEDDSSRMILFQDGSQTKA